MQGPITFTSPKKLTGSTLISFSFLSFSPSPACLLLFFCSVFYSLILSFSFSVFISFSFSLSPLSPFFSHGVVREKSRSRRRARGQHVRNSSLIDKAKMLMYVHILHLIYFIVSGQNRITVSCYLVSPQANIYFFHCCLLCYISDKSILSQLIFIEKKKIQYGKISQKSSGAETRG